MASCQVPPSQFGFLHRPIEVRADRPQFGDDIAVRAGQPGRVERADLQLCRNPRPLLLQPFAILLDRKEGEANVLRLRIQARVLRTGGSDLAASALECGVRSRCLRSRLKTCRA